MITAFQYTVFRIYCNAIYWPNGQKLLEFNSSHIINNYYSKTVLHFYLESNEFKVALIVTITRNMNALLQLVLLLHEISLSLETKLCGQDYSLLVMSHFDEMPA